MGSAADAWDSAGAERAVAMLKAVADPTRYRLLWALSGRELPVGSLAEMMGAHVAAVSQHLAKLRTAGLVASRREGTRIYYRVAGPHVSNLLAEAALAASASAAPAETADGRTGREPAVLAQEQAPAPRTVRARLRRPVTEH
ncbi:ArsR/SmtB family transcription factor [Streptomyces sp. NPDC052396]|uniref:ArsR/SmtB family transcription factor n=1 Tax=Streptomyces sp. NPDC052396 TaxID=3365689 RepID=UPI0037D34D64